jgi:hypothetical protein
MEALDTTSPVTRMRMLETLLPDKPWDETLVVTVKLSKELSTIEADKILKEWKKRDISREVQKAYLKMMITRCGFNKTLTTLSTLFGTVGVPKNEDILLHGMVPPKGTILEEIPVLKDIRDGTDGFRPERIFSLLEAAMEIQKEREKAIVAALFKKRPLLEFILQESRTFSPGNPKSLVALAKYLKNQ